MRKKVKEKESIPRAIFNEIRDSIIFEIVWGIILFIPRVVIRIIRNLY